MNNLSQELSTEDERFRNHLNGVFEEARRRLADAFEHGQKTGTVRADIDARGLATYILANLEGMATTVKTSRDLSLVMASGEIFLNFLEGLRTPTAESAA